MLSVTSRIVNVEEGTGCRLTEAGLCLAVFFVADTRQ